MAFESQTFFRMEPIASPPLSSSSHVVQLRQALTQRFPHLRFTVVSQKPPAHFPSGIVALDRLLGGGLARGQCTELVASSHGSGSVEVIHQLLRQVACQRQYLVLVDGMSSFDPGAADPAVLSRLLWIRCQQATEALKAVDLLLRDRNFPVLVLDLKLNPLRELRKITSSTWHRFGRLLEQNQAILLVVTPEEMVSVIYCRLSVASSIGLEALKQSPDELLSSLRFRLLLAQDSSGQQPLAEVG